MKQKIRNCIYIIIFSVSFFLYKKYLIVLFHYIIYLYAKCSHASVNT